MKNINKATLIIALITLILGFGIGWLFFSDGNRVADLDHDQGQTLHVEEWTCSMHPQIRQKEPGSCPLCGMDLIPVASDDLEDADPMSVKMSPTAMQLANVQTQIVTRQKPVKELSLNGKIQADESLISSQTTHISGRIEQLLLKTTGEYVSKGQIIAYIYSPELVTAQEELFEAEKMAETNASLFQAAKDKLKNWKLNDQQIADILSAGKPTENFPILSEINGVVLTKRVNLGDYIKSGASLFEIADLSRVWVLFDVYESDMSWVHKGDEITYTIGSLPGEKFVGRISFIDPVIDPKTRVAKARVVSSNRSGKLKPEMFTSGRLSSPLKNKKETIVIPKTAVMWTGEKSVVYVKMSTANGIHFGMRQITTGPSLGSHFIIVDGLEEGEEIATNGTFSIDAAAQLAGKPSMMNPTGGGQVMTGHQHGTNVEMADAQMSPINKTNQKLEVGEKFQKQLMAVFEAYLPLKDALVSADTENARKSVKDLLGVTEQVDMSLLKGEAHRVWMMDLKVLKDNMASMTKTDDMENMRIFFSSLSDQLYHTLIKFKVEGIKAYRQYCPMAFNNKGAYWLSGQREIRNPYFGDAMLSCGEIKEEIK